MMFLPSKLTAFSKYVWKLDFLEILNSIRATQAMKISTNNSYQVVSHENDHAYETLLSLPHYINTVIPINRFKKEYLKRKYFSGKLVFNNDADSAAIAFMNCISNFSYKSLIIRKDFIELVKVVSKNTGKFECLPLFGIVLSSLNNIPKHKPHYAIKEMYSQIEKECVARIHSFNHDQILQLTCVWYGLDRIKFSKVAATVLIKSLATSKVQHFVHLNFVLSITRINTSSSWKKMMETKLSDCFDQLSIQELGIVAMGMFKTSQFLRNQFLLQKFVEKVESSLPDVSSIFLGSFLKLFRQSFNPHQDQHYILCENLLRGLLPHLKIYSLLCLTQIASLGNNLDIFNEEILDGISEILFDDIGSLRLKDLERLLYALMNYGFIPTKHKNFLQIVHSELRKVERREEIRSYPESFVSIVYYFACLNSFPEDLISLAFKLLPTLEERSKSGRESRTNQLYWINFLLEFEDKELGERIKLTAGNLSNLAKEHASGITFNALDEQTNREIFILELKHILATMLGGENYVCATCVLPIMPSPDLVFCTNQDGQPLILPQKFLSYHKMEVKQPVGENLKWTAVIAAGTPFFIHNTRILKGIYSVRQRMLEKLGFNTCFVSRRKFMGLQTPEEKFLHISTLLQSSVDLKEFYKSQTGSSVEG